jgi:hypothetical protein
VKRFCRHCGLALVGIDVKGVIKTGMIWEHEATSDRLCGRSWPVKRNPDMRVQRFADPVDEGCLVVEDEKLGLKHAYWEYIYLESIRGTGDLAKAKTKTKNEVMAEEDKRIFDKLAVMSCPPGCLCSLDERQGLR